MKKKLFFLCTAVAVLPFSAYSLISTNQKNSLSLLLDQVEAFAVAKQLITGDQQQQRFTCFDFEVDQWGYVHVKEYYRDGIYCDRSHSELCIEENPCP